MCVEVRKEKDSGYPADFDAFWATYPRHVDKKRACRCWLATQKRGVHAVQLQNAAMNYAKACKAAKTEERFMKHPATFLGPDESWKEYLGSPNGLNKPAWPPLLEKGKCPNGHDYIIGQTCGECGWKEGDDEC